MEKRVDKVLVIGLFIEAIDPSLWPLLETVLDADERRRADQFVFEADRRSYVAAHALVRHALSKQARVHPAAWRFAFGAHGKPFLERGPNSLDLRFSLSHTRGMVAVALAQGIEVGVDVEVRERSARLDLDIAEKLFAPDEKALLRALGGTQERRERFLELWTLKEAVIKATGRGLSQSLDSFSIGFDPLRITLRGMPEGTPSEADRWGLAYWPTRHHHLSAAAHVPVGRPTFEHREWRVSELLRCAPV
jgi:4'-phosphopantetheinyl transferase